MRDARIVAPAALRARFAMADAPYGRPHQELRTLSATVLRKSYPAVKEAIAMMRHDVAALVEEFLGADEEVIANVRLAVSEAATSVVRSVLFEQNARSVNVMVARLGQDGLAVVVSDDGHGVVQPHREAGLGMGFVVMKDCADSLKLRRTPTGGIEIDMHFELRPPNGPLSGRPQSPTQPPIEDRPGEAT
jgi:anti-sigma regulatory factor (Ser/Thr protein kinase)